MNCVYIFFFLNRQNDVKRGLWRHADDKTAEFCTHKRYGQFHKGRTYIWTHLWAVSPLIERLYDFTNW